MNAKPLTVTLPKPLKVFVEKQASEEGYRTVGAYIQSLVQAAKKRQTEENLHALLLQGLKSGKPIEVTPAYWEAKRRRLAERRRKAQ